MFAIRIITQNKNHDFYQILDEFGKKYCKENNQNFCISGINSPIDFTYTGNEKNIIEFLQKIKPILKDQYESNLVYKKLPITHGLHSKRFNKYSGIVKEKFQNLVIHRNNFNLISTVDGNLYTDTEKLCFQVERQMTKKVLFYNAVKTALKQGCSEFIELNNYKPQLISYLETIVFFLHD